MDWLRRIGRPPPSPDAAADEAAPEPLEGAAPGVAALLEGVSEDRSHAVLDLGAAAEPSFRLYSRYARWIRFVDLAGDGTWPRAQGSTPGLLGAVPPQPERPYDLVFAWDALDRLFPEDRPRLVECLAERTAPAARLHVIVHDSDAPAHPFRFTLLGVNRIRYEPAGTIRLPGPRLLPAELMTLLEPFRVVRAFTLRSGLREYVAVRAA